VLGGQGETKGTLQRKRRPTDMGKKEAHHNNTSTHQAHQDLQESAAIEFRCWRGEKVEKGRCLKGEGCNEVSRHFRISSQRKRETRVKNTKEKAHRKSEGNSR